MIHWREGTVIRVTRERPGARELVVSVTDRDGGTVHGASGEGAKGEVPPVEVAALALTEIVGAPEPGEVVLLNVGALRKGLGTGGQALVVALRDRLPADPVGPGHIVKARYTPLQTMVCALEEQESPHRKAMASLPGLRDGDLGGMPVVVAELHSALPAILAGIYQARPDARVGYVMTDSAALPMAHSRLVADLVAAGWLATTISAGQAFGGEHEAITLHSALLAARHVLGCEIVVVAQGPGNAGSATAWGHSGISAGDALNAVHTLRGRAVAALRVSGADPRERHRGLSHHAGTTLGRVVLGAADVVTVEPTEEVTRAVLASLTELMDGAAGDLTLVRVDPDGLVEALESSPVRLSTMGRGLDDDPAAFLVAAAAGRHAAGLAS